MIAQRERALFDVLVDDLAHWVAETAPTSAAVESRRRSSSLAAASTGITGIGTNASAPDAAATASCTATATVGDRNRDFFDSIRDGRVLCALLGAISSQHSQTQTPMRGRSGSSAAASDFQARSVVYYAHDILTRNMLMPRHSCATHTFIVHIGRSERSDNLAVFLKGCKALGVPEVSLFEPDDLVQRYVSQHAHCRIDIILRLSLPVQYCIEQ